MAIPTETVWGLACDPFNAAAVQRFYQVKGRDPSKPSQVLCASREHALKLCALQGNDQQQFRQLCERFFPGSLTVVVPAVSTLPEWVAPAGKVGVRVPDHGVTLAFLEQCGGYLLASSLNRSQEPPALSYQRALELHELYDVIVPGEISKGQSSTVYDFVARRILREGPIALQEIEEVRDA
ncbi:hypothetical protein DC3_32980 [Deinococcus cellulosilyticus NBRC 106333 = KACC 11606]|uniref:L-threonylcarbamoyladenylate synthase n=1 Tax=Deinococcus cellulosilyticus (strain DSM 18568 / NBRC 106333 / KACC 11606 / 5516J-15) TaxID=1223518 RepID=A0A511N469_DEIC1|nr:hypothetical protein DC3_32980 [Deinococcus cellulosilyticus NBRC 106333 = KACC 11606]